SAWPRGPVETGSTTPPRTGLNLLLPPTALPEGLPTPTLRPEPMVGIVVGHWGDNNDPGAVCPDGTLTELSVNQNIATRVKDILNERGLDVVLLKEFDPRSEEHTSELQSREKLVCRLLLEKKKLTVVNLTVMQMRNKQ